LEPRRLHEGSDVRIEAERVGAALPSESPLPNGRWARVSDHPGIPTPSDLTPNQAVHPIERAASPIPEPMAAPENSKPNSPDIAVAASSVNHEQVEPAVAGTRDPASGETATVRSAESHAVVQVQGTFTTGAHAALQGPGPNTTGAHASLPRRPPVLASEALLRDIAPSRPARAALRIWCPLLGVLGTMNAWFLTHGSGLGWPLAGAFFGLALLGLPPMPYPGRASAVTTVAGTGLALVLWTDATRPGGMSSAMLTFAVTLLSAGLLFRAWHRASTLSRLMVAGGVMVSALFLWMSGDLSDLTLIDTAWQSWLPRLVGLAFGILLMLSLLAFMDARSTGGSAVWAAFALCWQALHSVVAILQAGWPKHEEAFDIGRVPLETLLAWTSTPLLSALLAIGLAQLMAAGLADATSRRTTPTLIPQSNPIHL
jgi:hypothetical protein